MKQYYKIGEISKLYHIGVDSLRYYEKIHVISPARSESGYRLYSVDDIWRLNVIRELRELGFPMEMIREYLSCHEVESTLQLLEEEKKAVKKKIVALEELEKNVETRMNTILSAKNRPLNQIVLGTYPERHCFAIHEGYAEEHEMDVLIKRLLNLDAEHFYVIGSNQIGTVISRNELEQSGKLKYQWVFLIDEKGETLLPGGDYLSVSYEGDYSQSAFWAAKLLEYAKNHGFQPVGDILELLCIDIHTTSKVDEQITELQLPVKKQ